MEGWFFSTPTLGVASWGSFCRSTKWLKEKIFSSFCISCTWFWRIGFFSPPTLGVASGGSFELWPELMPIPVSTRRLLNVLIGLAQIWVLQVAPFPCENLSKVAGYERDSRLGLPNKSCVGWLRTVPPLSMNNLFNIENANKETDKMRRNNKKVSTDTGKETFTSQSNAHRQCGTIIGQS